MSEDDEVLPKFICTDCWIKSKYFNEFYNAVAEAKNVYLMSLVKTEQPPIAEVNCDSASDDLVLADVKFEPVIDEDTSSIGPTDNGFDSDEEPLQNDNSVECGIDEHLNDIEALKADNNDKIKCERNTTSKYDSVAGGLSAASAAAELAKKVYEKTSTKSEKDAFKKLIPDYYDMKCESCNVVFKSLNQSYEHYRDKHDNTKVKMKCCPQPVLTSDIREHIIHHLNPDLYK